MEGVYKRNLCYDIIVFVIFLEFCDVLLFVLFFKKLFFFLLVDLFF